MWFCMAEIASVIAAISDVKLLLPAVHFLLHLLITPQRGKVRGHRPIIRRIDTCTISPFNTAPSVSSTTPPLTSRYKPVTSTSVQTRVLRWFLELHFESHIQTAISPSIFGLMTLLASVSPSLLYQAGPRPGRLLLPQLYHLLSFSSHHHLP